MRADHLPLLPFPIVWLLHGRKENNSGIQCQHYRFRFFTCTYPASVDICASSQETKEEGWFSSQEKKEVKVSFCHYNNFERRTSLPVDVDQVSPTPNPYTLQGNLAHKKTPTPPGPP